MAKSVLTVGNCSFDHGNLDALIGDRFDAGTTPAALADEAVELLRRGRFDLVLINRKLTADSSDGVELIERIKSDADLAATPIMLLSNFADAQQAAVAAGAEPGFGKLELDRPETVEKLARFLGD